MQLKAAKGFINSTNMGQKQKYPRAISWTETRAILLEKSTELLEPDLFFVLSTICCEK
jgi:hypothetical protein